MNDEAFTNSETFGEGVCLPVRFLVILLCPDLVSEISFLGAFRIGCVSIRVKFEIVPEDGSRVDDRGIPARYVSKDEVHSAS